MTKRLLSAGLLLFAARLAFAFEPFVVRDIRVDGLQRISAGTVFNYLPVHVGERLDPPRARRAIRALFATGFFKDVRLRREGGVLVVEVRERPAIASIKIEGNKDIETEPLMDSLKKIGFAEGRVFNRSLLDKVEQELQRQYFARGKYGVKIHTTVSPLERNRVAIRIDIREGKPARIRQINIVGNHVFDDATLLDLFELHPPTLFSYFTGSDQYSKQKLAGDLERLRSFYLDRGYLHFNIDSTQVTITPDRRDIYITVNVTEGARYRIRQVKMTGDFVVDPERLFPLIDINPGDVFSRKRVTEAVEKLGKALSDEGYAFANVNTIPEVDEKTRTVTLTFFIDPGKRVYVRRIEMRGNTRTADEILRREMRQMEGGWFSSNAVEQSRTRLERLGFFEEVNVETPAVPDTPDQVDVVYSVKEQPSGNLVLGLGYAQSSGFLFNANVTQNNFLGTGKRVSLNFNNSQINTIYSFSYNNPYATLDGISRGFGLFYRKTDAGQANLASYNTNTWGGDLSHGLPINEFDRIHFDVAFEHLELQETAFSPQVVSDFIAANGSTYDTFTLSASWSHDTRNRAIFADRGMLQRLAAEVTVPGSDLEYYKVSYRHLFYVPLTKRFTLSLNGEIGYGDGYGKFGSVPFFKNFYAGGVRSVRGWQDNTLGPRDPRTNDPIGGSFKVQGNVELLFPPPFAPKSRTVRLSAFFDIGNVFADYHAFSTGDLRYSVGLGATWMSPLGALTFSLAKPLNEKSGDETQPFQFTIGTNF
ncbi:MAG: outer membrane protein assembly factor BamA [Gammaproteobacteria bacterium]|nr:MAG: outer membrane protein assembly factor BamA [Gammaproteobacteria bacterium]